MKISKHPKFIQKKLSLIQNNQFGYNAFGLSNNTSRPIKNYIRGYKEKYLDTFLI